MPAYTDPPKRWVIFKLVPIGVGGRHLYWNEAHRLWVTESKDATQYTENQRMSMPLPPEGQYELLGGPLGKPEQWIILRLDINGRTMNPPEYWSNTEGWIVGIENATIFTGEERDTYHYLPLSGAWSELKESTPPPNWTEIDTSTD